MYIRKVWWKIKIWKENRKGVKNGKRRGETSRE